MKTTLLHAAAAVAALCASSAELSARDVAVSDVASLKAALAAAEPGDFIKLAPGDYEGRFAINRSGELGKPITIASADPSAPAVISAPAGSMRTAPEDFTGGAPQFDRAFDINDSAGKAVSDIVLEDLKIIGGIYIGRHGFPKQWDEFAAEISGGTKLSYGVLTAAMNDYFTSNSVPYEKRAERLGVTARRITVRRCVLEGRGLLMWHCADSAAQSNIVRKLESNIHGILLQAGCYNNEVSDNVVSDLRAPKAHWQGEGIRVVNFSNRNKILRNRVSHIRGAAFGFGLDVYADENLIEGNEAGDIETIAFTDQANNTGNIWRGNTARDCAIGFDFASFWWEQEPSASKSYVVYVEDNKTENCKYSDATAANIRRLVFSGNDFKRLHFSPKLVAWWPQSGSTWNGAPDLPPNISTEKASRFVKLF